MNSVLRPAFSILAWFWYAWGMTTLAFSTSDLALWSLGSAILAMLLAGAMNRRRQYLTELLRKHVESKLPSTEPADEAELGEEES